MSEPSTTALHVPSVGGRTLELKLTRYKPAERPRAAVLLLHGASAASLTFLVPRHSSLTSYLNARGYDVWLLDWRGGTRVADGDGITRDDRDAFTMDAVAQHDIPAALRHIVKTREQERAAGLPLHVIAHCFGAGCLAMSIADEQVAPFGVTNVVLLTLGLFYVAPWDGFIKADDFVIERVLGSAPEVLGIHPGRPWPAEMESSFKAWPVQLLPACKDPFCHRIAFMFGHPYLEPRLSPGIHTANELRRQFGSMPIVLYLHAGQNVRRGFAAELDARRCTCATPAAGKCPTHRYLQRAPFERHCVTLITGTENGIWHPDSIHRMHEHLMSGSARRSHKEVLRGYAHQDLLWGADAAHDVFPLITAGLERR